MGEAIRILIVEDNVTDSELAIREIRKVLASPEFQRVENREDYLQALETFRPDIILSDYHLPHFDGMTALRLALERVPFTPFIIWTGSMSEDTAVECMKSGASNYIIKENIKRLGPAVLHALEERQLNLDRQRAKDLVLESEQSFRQLFTASPDAIFLIDFNDPYISWPIVDCNDAACRMNGYSHEELIGHSIDKLNVTPGIATERKTYVEKLRRKESIFLETAYHRHKDGHTFPIEFSTSIITFQGKELVLGIDRDITERKRAEEKLQTSERTLKLFVEYAPAAIAMFDRDMRYIAASRRFLGDYQLTDRNVIGHSHYEIFPEISERWKEIHKRCLAGATEKNEEDPFPRTDGTTDWVRWEIHPWYDASESIGGIILFSELITERKLAEQALKESETKFSSAFQSSPLALTITTPEGKFVEANQAFCNLVGYSHTEIIGSTIIDLGIISVAEREKLVDSVKNAGGSMRNFEVEFRIRDGSVRDILYSLETIFLNDVPHRMSIGIDITERKRAEQEILKLNRVYAVLSNINQAIVRIHEPQQLFTEACRIAVEDGKLIMAWIGMLNENTKKIDIAASAGITEPYLSKLTIDLNDERWNAGPTGRTIQTGTHCVSMDIQHDETMLPLRDLAVTVGYRSMAVFPLKILGKVVGTFNLYSAETGFFDSDEIKLLDELASDISFAIEFIRQKADRKRAEEKSRRSERRYRALFEYAPDGIVIATPESYYIDANESICKMLGYTRDELIGMHASGIVAPSEVQHIGEALRIIKEKSDYHREWQFRRKDGSVFAAEVMVTMMPDGNLLGMIRDITERKDFEHSLETANNQLLNLFESMEDAYFSLDMVHYTMLRVSPAHKKVFGHDPAEFYKNPKLWYDMVIPEDKPIIDAGNPKLQTGESIQHQFRIIRPDGQLAWIEARIRPILDAMGKLIRLDGIASDITERKETEFRLTKSKLDLNEAQSLANIGNWDNDMVSGTTIISDELYRIFGLSPATFSFTLESFLMLPHPDDRAMVEQHVAEFYKTYQPANFDFRYIMPDGTVKWLYNRTTATVDENGKLIRVKGTIQDITERKRADESKKNLETQLQQAQKLESLGTLASGIAHDFNNILGIMIAHASLMERLPANKESIKKNTDAIAKAGMRGASLVKQMLTFARKAEVKTASLSLNEIVNEISKLLGETFPKTIEVSLQLENGLPFIKADATQIHQVLLNLCVNARDAMNSRGNLAIKTYRQPGKELQTRNVKAVENDYIVLSVSDTGTGMDEETKRRIFEPFFTTKELGKGTGLGLSLVFGIMETHQGFIEVESTIGKGTTFHCYFPLTKKLLEKDEKKEKSDTTISGGNENILFVEDEEMLRSLITSLLESKGYTVLTANDGIEGERLYQKHQKEIDLVVTDLGLPKFGGDELFRRIKSMNPDVRLIIASGFIEPGLKDLLLGEGVKLIVQKPYELDEILSAVREVLDKA